MDASYYDRFYRNLGEVMSLSPEDARGFIHGYSTGIDAFFESYFERLPIATMTTGTSSESGAESLFVKETNIGEGSSGIVMRNRDRPFAYKERRREKSEPPKMYFKSIFNEIIIQTLLQNDPTYGMYVCKIFKVFRKKDEYSIFIKMEQLTETLEQRYRVIPFDKMYSSSEKLKKILIKLFTILIHFRDTYGFQHLDFHTGNIMIAPHEGDILSNLKIIDFGLSKIEISDITIPGGSGHKDGKTMMESMLDTIKDINHSFKTLLVTLQRLPSETPLETYRLAIVEETSPSGGKRRYRKQTKYRRHPKKKRTRKARK